MKTFRLMFYWTLFALVWFSCSKDDDTTNTNIETTPSALSIHNTSSAGVYKGAFIGSKGYFKISIKNATDTTFCKLVFDGSAVNLINTSLKDFTAGEAISEALFTGTLNSKIINLYFSCSETGTDVNISITYPDHTITTIVSKEKSDVQVKCYEGTATRVKGAETINITWVMIRYGEVAIFYTDQPDSATGIISGTSLIVNGSTFYIDDNTISGTDTDEEATLTLNGKRTM